MALIDSGKKIDKDKQHVELTELLTNKDIKQYPLRIPASLYKKVRIKLMQEDKTLRDLIMERLNQYIKE